VETAAAETESVCAPALQLQRGFGLLELGYRLSWGPCLCTLPSARCNCQVAWH